MMKSLQDIKDEVAQEARKNRGAPFLRNYDSMIHSRTHLIEMAMDEVAKRYALEVAKEALENAAENATLLIEIHKTGSIRERQLAYIADANDHFEVDKQSILSENNIPELI